MAQVRTEQVNNVSSDQLVEFDRSGHAQVTVPEPLDGVLVRIWSRLHGGAWTLWDESERYFIRSVSSRGHIQRLTGQVAAAWLDGLPKRLSARAHALKTISQVTAVLPITASNRQPWESAILEARGAVRRAFPPRSEARFFERGWGGTSEGKLEFAEWLKDVLSDHGGTVLVTDPYFDVLGLDLISRASGAAKQIVVLTNTQVRSDDDEPGKSRAERLTKATEQLLPVLRGLHLKLCDLRSSGGGGNQLFHDRYLLLFDDNNVIEKGFNLSTSLQSAATTSPLLVTPIPVDVLDSVADYVANLMKPDENSGSELKELYSSTDGRARVRPSMFTEARARSVLSLLEQVGRASADPIEHLRNGGFFDGNQVVVSLSQAEWGRVRDYILRAGMPAAASVWDGLVECRLSDWRDHMRETLGEVFSGVPPELEDILSGYLAEHAAGRLHAENSVAHTRTLAHAFDLAFSQSVIEAVRFYDYHHTIPIGTSWPIHVAAHCLIQFFPAAVDRLIESLQSERINAKELLARVGAKKEGRPSSAELEAASRGLIGREAILSALTAALVDQAQGYERPDLSEGMKNSRVPFIRCLSAIAKLRKVQQNHEPTDPETFLDHLVSYDTEERRELLAVAVSESSWRAGSGANETEAVPLPSWLVTAVQVGLESGLSAERLAALIAMYTGPLVGSRAAAIQDQLLEPMVAKNAISRHTLLEAWGLILEKRLKEDQLGNADGELVEVWGRAFWNVGPEEQETVLRGIHQAFQRARGAMTAPLLRHRNFDVWHGAARSILTCLLKAGVLVGEAQADAPLRQRVTQLLHEIGEVVKLEELDSLKTDPRKALTRAIMDKLQAGNGATGVGTESKAEP